MLNSEKMVASIQEQDLGRADKYFRRALKEGDAEMLLGSAEYLESIGFLPRAREVYLQERERYPEVNINLTQIATEDGDIEGAFLYLDAISPESEAYLSALLVMADTYDMKGLTDVAHEKLLLTSEISDEPLVIFGLAEIELELGNFNQAIKKYAKLDNREVLELTGISTHQRIDRAYASLGKFEAAIESLEKAIEIGYDDGTIFELATILYDQEEYQKANVYFKQLDTMNPDLEGYEYVYAQPPHEENKTEGALRLVQKGLSKNEFDTSLLLAASQLSYELHDSKQAESYLLKAKDVAVDDEDVLMHLTNSYSEEERYEDVVALSRDNIDSVLTRWNIAKTYQALEADKEVLKFYDELAIDLADNPEFLQDYAYILREPGQRERAHQVAERYSQLVSDDVNMVEFLNENEF